MTVIDWLLDSDPAIRWQVMRDLVHEPADVVAAERARIATEGWGARLLALQEPDGRWGGRPWSHDWTDTFHVLELLRRFGLDPASEQARRAIALVRDNVTLAGSRLESPGRTTGSSRARSSRASTATSSRRARTSASTWRPRRPAARRAAVGRRLELRGGERRHGVIARDDDQRARGPHRARAGDGRFGRGARGPPPRRGVPARAPAVPTARRARSSTSVAPVLVPDLVPLRRAARPRLPAVDRRPPDPRVAEAIAVVEGNRGAGRHDGRSRTSTKARPTSRWRRARARPAAGTRSAPCASSSGTRRAGRRWGRAVSPRRGPRAASRRTRRGRRAGRTRRRGSRRGRSGSSTGSSPSRSAAASAPRWASWPARLHPGAEDDPSRRRAQRVEVRLVVVHEMMFWCSRASVRLPSSSVGSPNIAGSGAGWLA